MKPLDRLIRNAEDKYLKEIFEYCTTQFAKVHLPSHDQWHHLRVWNHAKLLLHILENHGEPINEVYIERLIIAVFFHDQGMSITHAKEHGKISRQICKTFFASTTLPTPSNFEKVLEAIEEHDKKNYSETNNHSEFHVQKVLNIADDLDAFGIVGAYRYSEIYLLRHIQITELTEAVLSNLASRFSHFSETFCNYPSLVKSQNLRYMSTRNFFKDLNMQLKLVDYKPELYIGPMGVINHIKNDILQNGNSLMQVIDQILTTKTDFYCLHFFERLKKELK